jgi:membrane-associated phospholipid phosphatase
LNHDVHAGWVLRLLRRFRHQFWIKTVGISCFMTLFFVAYFHVLRHPSQAPMAMPLTPLDAWVPFQAGWLWVYVSLWVYTGVLPGVLGTVRELARFGAWIGALCVLALGIFYFWPTAVPIEAMAPATAGGFGLLQGVDAPGNACPSLHVASALFTARWMDMVLQRVQAPRWARAASVLWVLAIVYSTVAIRQHVVLDVAGGALLAGLALLASRHERLQSVQPGERLDGPSAPGPDRPAAPPPGPAGGAGANRRLI